MGGVNVWCVRGKSSDEPAIQGDRFQVPSEFHHKDGEIGQRGDGKVHTHWFAKPVHRDKLWLAQNTYLNQPLRWGMGSS